MNQNTLKIHNLNKNTKFNKNKIKIFNKKTLIKKKPNNNNLTKKKLLSQKTTQHILNTTQLYLNKINYSPLLTTKKKIYFTHHTLHKNITSHHQIIKNNLHLIIKITHHYNNHNLTLLNLIKKNNLKLIHTIKKFNPKHNFHFSTYTT